MSVMEVDDATAAAPPSTTKAAAPVVGASNPFLQLFWDLAEEDNDKRDAAQQTLLSTLSTEQAARPSSSDPLAPNVRYALKRLFRGLCSSRAQARAGFSSALTALLSLPSIPIPMSLLFPAMTSSIAPPSSPSKQEQTDHKLGHAHAVLALCHATKASELEPADVASTVKQLLSYESSKVVREVAWRAVAGLVEGVDWAVYKEHIEWQLLKTLATFKKEDDDDGDQAKDEHDERAEESKHKHKRARKGTEQQQQAPLVELHQLTPERLSIILTIISLYQTHHQPLTRLSKSLSLSTLSPLSPSSFLVLVDILTSASYTLPSLHSVYAQVFTALLSSSPSEWISLYTLLASSLFFERASTARKQQGLLLFGLMLKLLPQHGQQLAECVSHLFHPSLLRTLVNNLGSPATHLHEQCKEAMAALVDCAREHREVVLAAVAGLSGSGGKGSFDAMTKTKTVSTLVGLMRREDLGRYVDGLISSFQGADERKKSGGDAEEEGDAMDGREKHHLWVLEQLYSATKQAALIDSSTALDNSATERVLHFFLFYAFFDSAAPIKTAKKSKSKKQTPAAAAGPSSSAYRPLSAPLSERVRGVCETRFWSLLDDLLPRPKGKLSPEEQKKLNKDNKKKAREAAKRAAASLPPIEAAEHEDDQREHNTLWSLKAHHCWEAMEKEGYVLLKPLSKEGRAVRASMLAIVQQLEDGRAQSTGKEYDDDEEKQRERERVKKERALSLLMLHVGLLQLSEEESATGLLQELELGYQRVWRKGAEHKAQTSTRKSTRTKKGKAAQEEDEEDDAEHPHPVFVEVLVDLLLSLLVRPSALIRGLARLVFVAFASDVNESALGDILRVVTQKSGNQDAAGPQGDDDDFQPFDVDDDAEDEDDDEDDQSIPSPSAPSKKRKRSTVESPSSPASSSSSSDDELIDLDSLDSLLTTPLTPAEQASVESASVSFSHYDQHLSTIIRLRQEGKKSQQADLLAQQVNFQLRVLDLLDVYVRVEGRSRLLVEMVMGRLMDGVQATRKGDEFKGLHERMVGLVHKIAKSKEHPTILFTEQDGQQGNHVMRVGLVQKVMGVLMERAQHAVDSELLSLLSLCLLHLIRISLPPSALVSPTSHATLPSPVHGHLQFVHSLYHGALTSYLTHRHSRLNSKFFSDFLATAPAIVWMSAPTIAAMALTPLNEEERKEAAANGFLRNDCFVWLGELFGRKEVVGQQPKEQLSALVKAVAKVVESALVYAALDDASKAKLKEARKEPVEEQKAQGGEAEPDLSGLSKEERYRYRMREKKKRRRLRQKLAHAAVHASSASSAPSVADSKAATHRLKSVLKTAATVQAQCKRMQVGDRGVLTTGVVQALERLREADVRVLRGAMSNLLTIAGHEELPVMRRVKEDGQERKQLKAQERQRAELDQQKQLNKERQLNKQVKEEAALKARELKRKRHEAQPQPSQPENGAKKVKLSEASVNGIVGKALKKGEKRKKKKAEATALDEEVKLNGHKSTAKKQRVQTVKEEAPADEEHLTAAHTNGHGSGAGKAKQKSSNRKSIVLV